MSKINNIKMFRSHRGQIMQADYHEDSDFPEFAGIPTIEALPKYYETEREIELVLERLPEVNPDDLHLPPLKRVLKLGNTRQFYIPVQRAINLALDFDAMLRWGLQERNPNEVGYVRKIHKGYEKFDVENVDFSGSTPVGIVLVGFGGTGKTQTMLRILMHYPQCIIHSYYRGQKTTFTQVVWLKLDCPEGGGRKGLLIAIFQALDDLLGTTYFEDLAKFGQATVDAMMPRAANVLQNHFVGALVIDEFQNFYGSQEGVLTLRFLRRLNNDLGVPIVLIGTPDAEQTLIGQFSLLRRASAYGNHEWREMKSGEQTDGSIGDWEVFFAALSNYYYMEDEFKYDQVSSALHKVTGGIPDLAVKVWVTTQNRLIRAGKAKTITAADIRRVARTEFPWIADAVDALREGTATAYRRYSDLYFRHLKQDTPKSEVKVPSDIPPTETTDSNKDNTPTIVPAHPLRRDAKSSQKKASPNGGTQPTILSIVDAGKKSQKSAYQSLLDAGFITSIYRFLS